MDFKGHRTPLEVILSRWYHFTDIVFPYGSSVDGWISTLFLDPNHGIMRLMQIR